MSDEPEEGSLINVQVTDLLGLKHLGKPIENSVTNLVNAIGKGIGWISDPFLRNLRIKADAKEIERIATAEAKAEIIKSLGSNIAKTIQNSDLTDAISAHGIAHRALLRLTDENLRSQKNREGVASYALEEFSRTAPSENVDESDSIIDEDWISFFWKTVESVSNDSMKQLFAKILVGEAYKPGRFSPRTVQTASLMNQYAAEAFQKACTLAFHAPNLGTHILEARVKYHVPEIDEEMIDPDQINELESLGILARGTGFSFEGDDHGTHIWVGDQECEIWVDGGGKVEETGDALAAAPFSSVGVELRSIASYGRNERYLAGLNEALRQFGVGLKPVEK